jgi:peptidoglycan/LPS O-acetylase OafA/YrhL
MTAERSNNNFDFLRIFAAICIAFTHSFNLLGKDGLEPMMRISSGRCDFSFIGLCIFFSISGYLITKSVYTSPSLLSYWWKRFLRIQPLLVLVCILSVFLMGPIFTRLTAKDYFASLQTWTYFRNIFPATGIQFGLPGVFDHSGREHGVNGSLWTLIVEERLYLAVSIFFFLKNKKKYFALLMGFINILYFFRRSIFSGPLALYLDGGQVFYAMLFLNAGVLYQVGVNFRTILKNKLAWLGLPALFVPLLFHSLAFLQVIFIPVLVIALAHIPLFTNRAGKWGDFTYGIYIFSFPVQQMLIASHAVPENPWQLFPATMLIVLPLAVASWHLLEKKCLSLKKMLQ